MYCDFRLWAGGPILRAMPALNVPDILMRILLAFAAGFIVGWERERRGRPAGMRTNILACVAAAVAMIVAEMVFAKSLAATGPATVRSDPTRLGAGILTGIGFLGAGTILRHDNFVRGVTTAATLWFVTVLGLAFGSGLFVVGGCGLAVALVTLLALHALEKQLAGDWYACLRVTGTLDSPGPEELRQRIENAGPRVLDMKLSYDVEHQRKTITSDLKFNRTERFELSTRILASLSNCPGLLQISWE